jgi:hypothetical protein
MEDAEALPVSFVAVALPVPFYPVLFLLSTEAGMVLLATCDIAPVFATYVVDCRVSVC